MQQHAPKSNPSPTQASANSLQQTQGEIGGEKQWEDNRDASVQQRKMQELVDNSPRVMQLQVYQQMANNAKRGSSLPQAVAPIQAFKNEDEHPLQGKFTPPAVRENKTGLSDQLKSGVEQLSGYSLDDVKVHYQSPKPAQLQAHAFAQGSEIHVAPGQEKHLPHEAWHVVQQKQGRVNPTMQLKTGENVNTDPSLEREADQMGARAISMQRPPDGALPFPPKATTVQKMDAPMQMVWDRADVIASVVDNKATYELDNVANTSIRYYGRLYWDENADSLANAHHKATAVGNVARAVRNYFSDDSTGWHVPTDKTTTKTVNTVEYSFYNDADGLLNFQAGQGGKPAAPDAGGTWDVNIVSTADPGKLKYTGEDVRSTRAKHFKVANMLREGITSGTPTDGSSSPAGYTWHHHADRGRMQLIDRDVHASFPHKGGFSIWGKA